MKKTAIGLVLGLTLGILAMQTGAQEVVSRAFGVRFSHDVAETYEMTVGVMPSGAARRPSAFEDIREQHHYPAFYGDLVAITGSDEKAVLWFFGADGVIRNAVVNRPARRPLSIQKTPFDKLQHGIIRGGTGR